MQSFRSRSVFASLLVAMALSGCGPSPVANNPPPADPGTASLRLEEEIVPFSAPVVCVNGVTAERSTSPTSLYCSARAEDSAQHHVEILLELGSMGTMPEGTELSTLSEVRLVRAGGGSRTGESVAADTASWDGAVTVTLGPAGTPRTAVLDGAISSVFSPSIAMTFRSVPIEIE